LDFSDEKGLQQWSDLLKFEAEKSLKQRLVFEKKNGLQLLSDILLMEAKKIETWWDFSDKKGLQLW